MLSALPVQLLCLAEGTEAVTGRDGLGRNLTTWNLLTKAILFSSKDVTRRLRYITNSEKGMSNR